jgi:hypothetical protein
MTHVTDELKKARNVVNMNQQLSSASDIPNATLTVPTVHDSSSSSIPNLYSASDQLDSTQISSTLASLRHCSHLLETVLEGWATQMPSLTRQITDETVRTSPQFGPVSPPTVPTHIPRDLHIPEEFDYCIELASGPLHFNVSDIPDPPPQCNSDCNIAVLDAMWDGPLSSQWQLSLTIKIRDIYIPLSHWPDVYRYRKNLQWKGTKQRWYDWKVTAFLYSHIPAKYSL